MALLARKAKLVAMSRFSKPIRAMDETIEHRFRVGVTDLDENRHMNNARYLQYMELGRWDMMVRTGFLKYALKAKVMSPVTNLTTVYRRPLSFGERFTVKTRILRWDDRTATFEHALRNSRDEVSAIGIVECRILSKDKSLTLTDIVRELGVEPGQNHDLDHTLSTQSSTLAKAILATTKVEKTP